MSSNAYGNPWKYMIKRFAKAFKTSTPSEYLKEFEKNKRI